MTICLAIDAPNFSVLSPLVGGDGPLPPPPAQTDSVLLAMSTHVYA
jgi:hypothetical protein